MQATWYAAVRILLACMIALMLVPPVDIQASPQQQGSTASQSAQAMLARMTPEERVGQLFLVTLSGTNYDENAQIHDLIANHHLGGVMLLRGNDNFSGGTEVLAQTRTLTQLLQESEWDASQQQARSPTNVTTFTPAFIPLLIGTSQEGDLYPNDQVISGVTPLPNLMAIGATWNPDLAEQVGGVMGKELSALGFNLYLGPSLDVLDTPQIESGEDLGVRTFGGDPYWVGRMGQSYIAGLHKGSKNRMAVIAKHFPGRGGSDRSPEEEIATVRKSLEQLKQIELAPFFSVTGSLSNPDMLADGLLVSHIRYQGFQGNIRATTRPVSSDAAALELILNQPPLNDWRAAGGLMVSDNLGSQAVRRFYDPTGSAFDARTAAREAFFAGNDLLFLDRFVASTDPDAHATIVRTLDFFAQKYREDPAFAQRVDASVERILTLKYRMYPQFSLEDVLATGDGLSEIGNSQEVTFNTARRAVTLVSPSPAELLNELPGPPGSRDRIIFLTDVQSGRQCSGCSDQVTLTVDALQSAVLRLYGPRGSGQVNQGLMSSYPFSDLWRYLNGVAELPPLEDDLQLADWVVVSMLKPDADQPASMAFRRLLNERPDLLRNKKVIVFAFNAPYYLDATDISKLTAYYAMYSKSAPFVDVAARVLFQEMVPTGVLPVSVPGVGYDLIQATSPNPAQVIPLYIDASEAPSATETSTPAPVPAPNFEVNDVIPLRTGVIYDHNGKPVPDGTPVRFMFNIISETSGSSTQQIDTVTKDGAAAAMYRIERSGILEIHAATDSGARTSLLRLDTVSGGVTVVPPTAMPTETPTVTPTVTPTESPTPTATSTPPPPPTVGFSDWFFGLLVVLVGAVAAAYIGVRQAVARWGLRWALCGVIGGLLAYNYLALKLPGTEDLLRDAGTTGVIIVTVVGVLLGWLVGFLWMQFGAPLRSSRERPATGPKSQSN